MKGLCKNIILLAACLFLTSACSVLTSLDNAAGKLLSSMDQPISSEDLEEAKNEAEIKKEQAAKIDFTELTRIQKKAIDEWLGENGLNRYGDEEETNYAGGTPLVDESTGDSINRFEYILERIPDILEKIE